MKKLFVPVMIVLTAAALGTQAADDAKAKAKANFTTLCKGCHGVEGKGDTKLGQKLEIRNYADAKVQAQIKDDEMFKAIKDGLKKEGKTLMKPYGDKLKDEEIKALVAYVRAFKKN